MKLSTFDERIEEHILFRGKAYYENGHVKSIKEKDNDHYTISVAGTRPYTVEVSLSSIGIVMDLTCDCPYDMGDYCKHQVAALYALKDYKNGNIVDDLQKNVNPETEESDLKKALNKMQKAELVNLLVNLAEDDEDVENKLQYMFVDDENELEVSKKLIRDYINSNKRQGFIHYRDCYDALKGVFMTLEKAETKLAVGKVELAMDLTLASLTAVANMVNYSDDSDGYIGDVTRQVNEIVNKAVAVADAKQDDDLKNALLDKLMKEARKKKYEDWDDWRNDLYMASVPLLENKKRRDKLEKQVEKHLESIDPKEWGSDHEIVALKKIQYEIISRYDDENAANHFIEENLQYHEFREKAIQFCITNEDYEQALELCETGKERDKEYRGIVSKWKNYEFIIYEVQGDIEKQRQLARNFVLSSDSSYYEKLKALYCETEWPSVLDDLLEEMDPERSYNSIYIDILKKENLKDRILVYCQNKISSITDLYPYLIDDYPEEVERLFRSFIEKEAEYNKNRKEYRSTAKLIRTYKKVCGTEVAETLISELKEKYKRRPAMVEELEKIK